MSLLETIRKAGHLAVSPPAMRVAARDLLGRPPHEPRDLPDYAQGAARWLARAQDATPDDGVSAAYTLYDGWMTSYLETTGYIIPTFYDYAQAVGDETYDRRARDMASWLVDLQMDSGAYQGGRVSQEPVPRVFNTGQIMLGLLRAHDETGDERFRTAIQDATEWLLEVQDDDGAWRRHNHQGAVPAYNARVAWPLVATGLRFDDKEAVQAGRRFLDWVVDLQHENGWFPHVREASYEGAFIHFLVYTARGLAESGRLLEDDRYIESAHLVGERLLEAHHRGGRLPGNYHDDWSPATKYSCLFGNAQTAILWRKLSHLDADRPFPEAAREVTLNLVHEVDLETRTGGVRGALKGGSTVWGRYMRFAYPNWGTKFLLDALLQELDYDVG